MNICVLTISCLVLVFLYLDGVDGKLKCHKCKGSECNTRRKWSTCSGDACFKRVPGMNFPDKHHAVTHKESHWEAPKKPTTKTTTTKKSTTTTKKATTTKATTKKSTTTQKLKTTSPTYKPKSTTLAYFLKLTTKPTMHMFGTIKQMAQYPSDSTTKHHYRRSVHGIERGCMKEKELTHIHCLKEVCVCITDMCNGQTSQTPLNVQILVTAVSTLLYNIVRLS